jgi:hypothetical protein
MKLRLVHAALAAFTIWPLIQLVLVARFDVSPWKLCGWGMYSTPRLDTVEMEVYGRVAATGRVVQLFTPSAPLLDEAHRFLESYRWLRSLAPQASLVRTAFADHPAWDEVRLVLLRAGMDRSSGMIEPVRVEYVHTRPVMDTSRAPARDR